jgi:hypothetical protein
MVTRIAPVGVVSFVLLAACGAVCQNVPQSLPDAPLEQAATQKQGFNVFIEDARWPLKFSVLAGVTRESEFAPPDKAVFSQKESNTVFGKHLYRSVLKQQPGYHSSSGGSFIGRATYAVSRIFVTRDDSGQCSLNTSYLLQALSSVAADTASRPYWRRSFAEPFSDFGSTVGNDAGMNLWHGFEPGIEHLMKSHMPKFISKIEERIGHN